MITSRATTAIKVAILLVTTGASVVAFAYEGRAHQQLTFIAARQFNNCVPQVPALQRFSALDTRYIVKANVAQADGGVFSRMFRWSYYNRADQTGRTSWGVIDTRFHDHFEELVDDTRWSTDKSKRLKNFGRILNYIQDVTSPARVVPVFTNRWWRFSVGDRFDRFRIDTEAVEQAVENICAELVGTDIDGGLASFQDVLEDAASQTILAVRAPIYGFPATWQAYWEFASEPDAFGEYGPAGNTFGERTEFRCGGGERCLLLESDPLYRDFAVARHIAAVTATMRAMALMQLAEGDRLE